jgi:hypothetical protein
VGKVFGFENRDLQDENSLVGCRFDPRHSLSLRITAPTMFEGAYGGLRRSEASGAALITARRVNATN